ncbi:MAG TPA: acyl carrier protein [Flavobacteriales bacterium]|nr:acyl carrier protein [Flavobacteriales bacterium]
MDEQIICDELRKFLKSGILAEGVEIEKETLLKDLGIDSYSVIEMVLFIERKFGVALPDQELTPDNLKSIESLANCTMNCVND